MTHPDTFNGLLDWPLFGPRGAEIAKLLDALAAGALAHAEERPGDRLRTPIEIPALSV